MSFADRVRQLFDTLKTIKITIDDNELAISFLNGFPERFDSLISALNAVSGKDKIFSFSYVIDQCEQEEKRHSQCNQEP